MDCWVIGSWEQKKNRALKKKKRREEKCVMSGDGTNMFKIALLQRDNGFLLYIWSWLQEFLFQMCSVSHRRMPDGNYQAEWRSNFSSKSCTLLLILFKHSITTYILAFCAANDASLINFIYIFCSYHQVFQADLKFERWKEIILRSQWWQLTDNNFWCCLSLGPSVSHFFSHFTRLIVWVPTTFGNYPVLTGLCQMAFRTVHDGSMRLIEGIVYAWMCV